MGGAWSDFADPDPQPEGSARGWERVPRFVVLALFVLLLAPAASAKPLDAPKLSVGDFFEIRDTIGSDHSPAQARTFRDTVEALETITVNGTSYEAVRIGTTFLGPGGNGNVTIQRWVRASDGAAIRERSTDGANAWESTYDPPCAQMRYPLDVGDAWTSACTRTQTSGGQSTTTSVNNGYRVLRRESVQVPAGTFDAFVIAVTGAPGSSSDVTTWEARETCGLAKAFSAQPGYNDTYELMAYHCAATTSGRPAPAPSPLLAAIALGAGATLVQKRGRG